MTSLYWEFSELLTGCDALLTVDACVMEVFVPEFVGGRLMIATRPFADTLFMYAPSAMPKPDMTAPTIGNPNTMLRIGID